RDAAKAQKTLQRQHRSALRCAGPVLHDGVDRHGDEAGKETQDHQIRHHAGVAEACRAQHGSCPEHAEASERDQAQLDFASGQIPCRQTPQPDAHGLHGHQQCCLRVSGAQHVVGEERNIEVHQCRVEPKPGVAHDRQPQHPVRVHPRICSITSARKFSRGLRAGLAACTRLIPKLDPSPSTEHTSKKPPMAAGRPREASASQAPEAVPTMMATNVDISSTPLPQESKDSGSSSGSRPYLEGLNSAACVLIRNNAANSSARLPSISPAAASRATASSRSLVAIVIVRLLQRSAKYPPYIENSRNGALNSSPTTITSRPSAMPAPRAR